MKVKQKFGNPRAVVFLVVLFTAIFLFTAGVICAKTKVKADGSEGPRKLITGYMNALRDKDFDKVFKVLGFNVDEKILDKLKEWLSNEDYFVWRISGFKITGVKVDGGFAKVYVVETDYKEFKGKTKELGKIIPAGVNSISEVFYLFKDEGKWKIDPCNSGIDLRAFPLTAEKLQDMDKILKEEDIKKWVGTISFGQIFTILGDRNSAPLASLLVSSFLRAQAESRLVACESNLWNMGTALEMYATDNNGHYPISLSQLTPDYLRSIPTCPAAGKDTYSISYTSSQNPDAFTFYCSGNNHQEVDAGENYPIYTSAGGLLSKKLGPESAFRHCESNLKNIATALEMYSTDNEGHYPASLKQLVPNYIQKIPACPAAGKDTYSISYKSSVNPDAFTVYCSGNNHKEVNAGENCPMYTSEGGLSPGSKEDGNIKKDNGSSGKG
ncbi:MAG: hypothetical protein M1536_02760 [Firmicutes bacterium]|nr:hypothetical protein [Bacillota bacterium]